MANELRFPLKNDTSRKIIHLDMDAFYASVEERDNPDLRDKPLVIARHPKETGGKGVVTTANYVARKYGIHSAMSAQKAYELCPTATFVPGDYHYYREISSQIHEIFHRYTDVIEPIAFDEAYLDVTENKVGSTSAIKIARMIQRDIWQELQLTCSAGVSYNKFIAKLASDFEKPRGLTLVLPEDAIKFLKEMPIEKFHGVGKKTVVKMNDLGIFNGSNLYDMEEMALIQNFGKMGYDLYRKVRGIHNAPVNPNRERKSIGRENTFSKPLISENQVVQKLRELASDVSLALKKHQKHGQTVVLKVRYDDYETITRRRTLDEYVDSAEDIFFHTQLIWEEFAEGRQSIRLLGITVTNLDPRHYETISLDLK